MKQQPKEFKTTIGGQALIEGILMRGPRKTAIVVRKPDGEFAIKEEEVGTIRKNPVLRLPLIRGVLGFWDSMKYGISALTYSAEFFEEEDPSQQPGKVESWLLKKFGSEKLDKILMGFALVTGIALPVALFILLPTLLAGFLPAGSSSIVRNLLEGVVRILIFLAFIIVTSKQSDIKRTYMYHGAEHKTIACYEKGWELTVDIGGGFFMNALYVALGELAVLLTFGTALYYAVKKRHLDTKVFGG